MFRLSLILVTVLPLIGMYRMENGGYGMDIGQSGYANGATIAYLWHLLAFWFSFALVTVCNRIKLRKSKSQAFAWATRENLIPQNPVSFSRVAKLVLLIQFALCVITFGPLGAYQVLFYGLGRGEFRSGFGALGPFAMFESQWLSPMLCALVSAVYRGSGPCRSRLLLVANCLLTALNMGMWGYRSAAAISLMPALVVLFPSVRLNLVTIRVGLLVIASILAGQIVFGSSESFVEATESIWDRSSTGTANSAWKVWDLHQAGHSFPSMWPTFRSILPNRLNEALGVWIRGAVDYYQYSFSGIMTAVVKDYDHNVDITLSNVTVTSFCTGLIMFGSPGYLIISALAGLIAAANDLWIESARRRQNHVMLALASTYSITSVWAFMNNGDPLTLFNVAAVIYYFVAMKCCSLVLGRQKRNKRRTVLPLQRQLVLPNASRKAA